MTLTAPAALRLTCAGCGWTAPDASTLRYPFRCPHAGTDDVDHVVTRILDPAFVTATGSDEPNPFIRHRQLFTAWHAARGIGVSDEAYVDLVRSLDEQVAAVDGRGFHVTPFAPARPLGERLGLEIWVKDETGNVSGSHKSRHLMGILLYLAVMERRETPPLAIASCGNAALAAAVLAHAVARTLRVFVPPHAEAAVLDKLHALGADVVPCPRVPGQQGDPCVHQFHDALRAGALPFCVQGNENGLTIEGGETLVEEMLAGAAPAFDHMVVQVGGGALASSCMQALARAARGGRLARMPRVHTVQTEGAWPLRRAWRLWQEYQRRTGASPTDALRYAGTHRAEFMWPWEQEPTSVAEGILDDETYDWLAVMRGMAESGGMPVVADEATLKDARRLAREHTGIAVSHTGSAGLAGVLQLQRDGVIKPGERVALVFSGVERS
ncbi:MAG: PLP-dependent lyase/thiolase [Gemmatimonadaceae bacterium]